VIVERYSYDVFGEPNTTSSIGNPYMFTGRRYDIETGLYYYRARYYKPEIGRFLQTDPIGYEGGLNLYAYVQNNPVMFTDPLGLLTPGMGNFYYGRPVDVGPWHEPKPPGWHRRRNVLRNCPPNEPKPGSVDECSDNPNPWRREGWNPFHEGQSYRRRDRTGTGGSQCSYDQNGNLIGGTYDWVSPETDWYKPWGRDRWRRNFGHFQWDVWPYLRWGDTN